MKLYDSVVIGGGPAGMTAALYLVRSGATIAWVEKLAPGGQVLMTETIDNYPGFPKGIKGYELVDVMAAHLDHFEFDKFNDAIRSIEPVEGKHRLLVGDQWIEAKTVIICTGASFKHLGLPKEDKFTGKGVSYCALCDGNFFRGQVVGVVGGGNTALEESLYLAKLVEKLYLIHRRDAFRGCKLYEEKVRNHPKIELVLNSVVSEILGEDGVAGIKIKNLASSEERSLDLNGLFIFVGYAPAVGFLPKDLTLDSNGFIITDVEMRTNLPGIFAAGDVRSKLCRQVCTAVGDGATAANAAFHYLEHHS
jgi:thioredoxin reductase (NADPH)